MGSKAKRKVIGKRLKVKVFFLSYLLYMLESKVDKVSVACTEQGKEGLLAGKEFVGSRF